MASRPGQPPQATYSGEQTTKLRSLVTTLVTKLRDGKVCDASVFALSCRPFLPYALAAIVGDMKSGMAMEPAMVNFIADMAMLFPAVRPVLKDAVPRSAWAAMMLVADGPTKDSLAQSLLMLELAGCLSSSSIDVSALGCARPACRWVAAVSDATKNNLSASASDTVLRRMLTHEELCASESLWEQRQMQLQVCAGCGVLARGGSQLTPDNCPSAAHKIGGRVNKVI